RLTVARPGTAGPELSAGPRADASPGAESHADDREVVGFGAAAGEGDVRGAHPEHLRHPGPGIGEGLGRDPADLVMARRIAERPGQIRPRGLERLPTHRSRRGGVEVEPGP